MIGGNALTVNLNVGFFQKYDTRSKVLAAADDPKCFENYGSHFVTGATVEGQRQTGRPGLIQRDGVIYATIVKELKWEGKPPTDARIDGHSVIVKDFGTVYFGELLIGRSERRLTMVRFELGSPIGGYADVGDVGVERERISVRHAALTGLLVVSIAACAPRPEATSSATVRFRHRSTLARRADGCLDRRERRDGRSPLASRRRRGPGDSGCSRRKSIWSAAIFLTPRHS